MSNIPPVSSVGPLIIPSVGATDDLNNTSIIPSSVVHSVDPPVGKTPINAPSVVISSSVPKQSSKLSQITKFRERFENNEEPKTKVLQSNISSFKMLKTNQVLSQEQQRLSSERIAKEMAISAARRPGISVPLSNPQNKKNESDYDKRIAKELAISAARIPVPPPDPAKQALCRELFGRTDNGCLELTMQQLDTMKMASINGININTGAPLIQIYEEIVRIRPVMDCLLELANKYGAYDSRGRMDSRDTFQFVYSIIQNLTKTTNKKNPATEYQKMLEMRHSISDEIFTRIVTRGFYPREPGYDAMVASINRVEQEFGFLNMFTHPTRFQYQNRFTNDFDLRKRLLSIMDCIISIMLQLYPELRDRMGVGIRHKRTYKKRRTYKKHKKHKSRKHNKSYKKKRRKYNKK